MQKENSSPPVEQFKAASAGVVVLTLICLAVIWYVNGNSPQQRPQVSDQGAKAVSPRGTLRNSSTGEPRDSNRVVHEDEPFLPQFAPDEHNDPGTVSTPVSHPGSAEETSKNPVLVPDQTIRDLNGHVVFTGTIDLKPTLDRIERGEANRHRNDGTTFQNREGRLPRKPGGYYKEYVHPTQGEHGPGPQRIILGREGEIWYTPDHYRTFKEIEAGGRGERGR